MPEIEILQDAESLAARASEAFTQLATEALQTHGRFTVALAGGSTPLQAYKLMADASLEWLNIHIFWGDERCVPPVHPESNYGSTVPVLLDRIAIPPGNVHRIHGEIAAEEAARDYELELRRFFQYELPRFDLVMLGLGPDGHTASLFPGAPAVHERNRWTAAVTHRTWPPPPIDRVTLTLPVFNASANVIFLVAGADKAEIFYRVQKSSPQPDPLPAQAVKPASGNLRWLVDRFAAARILSRPESSRPGTRSTP
jgi:6-phosphogluconolactonase